MQHDILITQQKIKTWQKEKATIEQRMKADHERLSLLNRRLENLALYIEPGEQIPVGESVELKLMPSTAQQSLMELNPPAAVEAILKTTDRPMTGAEIKGELKKANYPVNKFGKTFNYLYSILGRMVLSGRAVKIDGRYKLA